MRLKPSPLRRSFVPPDQAPILRYAVAILSVDLILALIPAFLLSDIVVESRLVVFSVAIMVSAWYGGWKPGLLATAFAYISCYLSL
jgi:glucose-6-phosphate-specific signal transduction histidine kinase